VMGGPPRRSPARQPCGHAPRKSRQKMPRQATGRRDTSITKRWKASSLPTFVTGGPRIASRSLAAPSTFLPGIARWYFAACVFAMLAGCRAEPPTDQQMRTALAEALGAEPPRHCELLGYRRQADVSSWLVRAERPLQLGDEATAVVRREVPAQTLLGLAEAFEVGTQRVGVPRQDSCQYTEWTVSKVTCRLWQLPTDDGAIACLETVRAPRNEKSPPE